MQLARVIGTVVATRKYRDLDGIKFLVIQPLSKQLQPKGRAGGGRRRHLPGGTRYAGLCGRQPRGGPGLTRAFCAR